MPATTLTPPTQVGSRTKVFRDAQRDMTGLALGYIPFAVAIGATISSSGLNKFAGWAGAPALTAGSSHLALIKLLTAGGGAMAAAGIAVLINARIAAYSAGLAPWFSHETRVVRLMLAVFIIDPTYLLAIERFQRDDPGPGLRRWYFLGLASVLHPLWMLSIAFGVVAGNVIPADLELGLASPLMMTGMLALSSRGARASRAAALLGLALGAIHLGLPAPAVTITAAGAALAVGYSFQEREE